MIQTVDKALRTPFSEQLTNTEVPAGDSAVGNRFPIAIRRGFDGVIIATAAAGRVHLVPAIRQMYFYDASRDPKQRWIDLLAPDKALIDRSLTGDTGKALNAMTTADYIYFGFYAPVRGLRIDMDAALVNAVATTLTAEYSQGGAFTSTAITDGTANGGATLAQDGVVSIDTVPASWTPTRLSKLVGADDAPNNDQHLYWLRLDVSDTLTNGTEIEKVTPLAEIGVGTVTTDSQSIMTVAATEYTFRINRDEIGAIEVLAQAAAASTANLTWISR